MSATISSSVVESTIVTTYAWTGAANASHSVQRVDGVEKRRNHVNNPGFESDLASWSVGAAVSMARVTGVTPFGTAAAKITRLDGNSDRVGTVLTGLTPNVLYRATAVVQRSGAPTNITMVVDNQLAPYITTDDNWQEYVYQFVPTSSTAYLDLAIYPGAVTGAAFLLDNVRVERFSTIAPPSYFDGNTPASTIVKQQTSTPTLVLGFETARASQSIFHDIIGGGQDVTLRPAALRSGTLRLFYVTEVAAAAALDMHSKAAVFYIEDPDRAVLRMYYAVDGAVRLALDDSREVWTLDVAYREVTP